MMNQASRMALLVLVTMSPVMSTSGDPAPQPLTVSLNDLHFPDKPGYHVLKATAHLGTQPIPFACGIFLPPAYFKSTEKMPIVMSLHTRGNSGADGGGGLVGEGLGLMVAGSGNDPRGTGEKPKNAMDLLKSQPFITLLPQCIAAHGWNEKPMPQILAAFITQVAKAAHADEDRVYLTGFSYGGSSTWEIALQVPERFAGIVPLDGRATHDPAVDVQKLKDVAIYESVGSDDPDFMQDSKRMRDALLAMKHSRFIYHLVQGGNHWCYGSVYNDPEFWKWLLAQRRPSKSVAALPATQSTR